jgi:hypothetical protein
VLLLVALVCTAYFNWRVDPFHYYALRAKGPFPERAQYVYAGAIKHGAYEALIVGNSHARAFRASEFEKRFKLRTFLAAFPASSVDEQALTIRHAADTGSLTTVFWLLDYRALNRKFSLRAGFPDHLYEPNLATHLRLLLSFGTTEFSLLSVAGKGAKQLAGINRETTGGATGLARVMRSFKSKGERLAAANEATALRTERVEEGAGDESGSGADAPDRESDPELSEARDEAAAEAAQDRETQLNQVKSKLSDEVTGTMRALPDVTFHLLLAPTSMADITLWDSMDRLEEQFVWRDELFAQLNGLANVRIHDFQAATEYSEEWSNYRDTHHFVTTVGARIAHDVSKGTHEVDSQTAIGQTSKLRRQYAEFQQRACQSASELSLFCVQARSMLPR